MSKLLGKNKYKGIIHKIKFVHEESICGDGCCHEYSTNVFINDNLVFANHTPIDSDDMRDILEGLEINYEIEEDGD